MAQARSSAEPLAWYRARRSGLLSRKKLEKIGIANGTSAEIACGRSRTGPGLETRRAELDEGTGYGGNDQKLDALGIILTDLKDFGRCLAFREHEVLFDNQGSPEWNSEQDAEQAADTRNCGDPPIVEYVPVTEEDQGGKRKDDARSNGFARGCGRLHDVVLEYVGLLEHLENGHRYHGGRDRGRNRHAGEKAQIGIGARQYHRQHDAKQYGFER